MSVTSSSININQGLAPVQLQEAVSTSISREECRAEEKSEPLFQLMQTRGEKLLAKLYSEGIIDETGNLKVDVSQLRLPSHNADQLRSLKAFLEEPIFLEAGNSALFYQYLVNALKSAGFIEENHTLKTYTYFQIKKNKWAYAHVYQLLCERHIVDKQGKLTIVPVDESVTPLPKFNDNPKNLLTLFLNKQLINVSIGAGVLYCSVYISREKLLQQVCASSPKPISSLRIVGGRARKRILQSPEYCKDVFEALFKMLNHDDKACLISEELIYSSYGEPTDDDFRIHVPTALVHDLMQYKDNMLGFLSHILFDGNPLHKSWIQSYAFSKFNYIDKGQDHYSISLLKSAKQEVIFYASLSRRQLFTDEVEEDISSYFISGSSLPFFSSEGAVQAIICLLGNVFHVKQSSEVNHQGFFKMISRLIQGKLISNVQGLDTLTIHAANEDPKKIATLMIDCLQEHHASHLETAALVSLFTACSLLEKHLNHQQIGLILKKVEKAFFLSECHTPHPVGTLLAKKMANGNIPFPVVNAAVQIACFLRLGLCFPCDEAKKLSVFIKAIEDRSVLQLQMKSESKYLSLWSPFTIQSAIKTLVAFMDYPTHSKEHGELLMAFFDSVLLDSLTQQEEDPVLVRYKKFRHLDLDLKETAQSLMDSSQPFCEYLGYCLLLTIAGIECDDALASIIIKKFPEAYFFQTHSSLRKVLLTQLKYTLGKTKFAASVNILNKKFQDEKKAPDSYEEMIGQWIEFLAETGEKDFCKISCDLWFENSSKTASTRQQEIMLKLFAMNIKHFPQYAEKLLLYTQNEMDRLPFEKEMKCVGHLLLSFKNNWQQEWPSTLIKINEAFLKRKPDSNEKISDDLIKAFTSYFLWFVDHLIESSYLEIPYSLLASANQEGLIQSSNNDVKLIWLKMANASRKDPLLAYRIWNKAHSLKIWRDNQSDEAYLDFVCSLSLNLSSNPTLQNELECLLDQITKKTIHHPSANLAAQQAVSNQIMRLITEGRLQEAVEKIQKFKGFLAKNISIDCGIHLCRGYIKKRDFSSAMPIWDKLASLPSNEAYSKKVQQLCEEILDQLAYDLTNPSHVSLLCKILNSKSIYLCSSETQIQYLKKSLTSIRESIPFSLHSDLVQALLERLDEVKRMELVSQLLQCYSPKKSLDLLLCVLHGMGIEDPKYWKACLDAAANQDDLVIANQVWKNFKQFYADRMHAGSPKEMDACWLSALKVLTKAKHPDILLFLVQCLEPNSLFHSIFSQDSSDRKHEVASDIIHHCLVQPIYHNTISSILSLRKELPAYSSASQYMLPILLKLDVELIDSLIQMDGVNIFMGACDRLVDLLQKDDNDCVPFNSKRNLLQKVLNSGAIYEKKSQNAEQTEDLVKKINSVFMALYHYYNSDNRSEFLTLSQSLANYTSPLILQTLLSILAKELADSNKLPENYSESPSTLGMALDSALKNCCNHSNSEIGEQVRQILIQKSTENELGKSLNSFHWGNYLLAQVKAHLLNSDTSQKADCILFLLKHFSLLAHNIDIRERYSEQIVELLTLCMQSSDYQEHMELIVIFFFSLSGMQAQFDQMDIGKFVSNGTTTWIIPEFNSESVFNYAYDAISQISNSKVPLCICHAADLKKPHVTEFRKQYYKYMTMIIKKILANNYEDLHAVYIHSFVWSNILLMLPIFPEYGKEMAALIHLFVFWPITLNHALRIITADKILTRAFESGVYQNNPDRLVEAWIFLGLPSKIPPTLTISNLQPAVKKAIQGCLKINSANSIGRAISIFNEHFKDLADKAASTFKLILENSREHLFSLSEGEPKPICQRLCDGIVSYRLDPKLFFWLFEQLYLKSKEPNSKYYEPIMNWISAQLGLIDVMAYLVKNQSHDVTGLQYYQYVEKILPDILTLLTIDNLKRGSAILISNLITAPEFNKKPHMMKKRAELFQYFIQGMLDKNDESFYGIVDEILKMSEGFQCTYLNRATSPLKAQLKKALKIGTKGP